MMAAMATLSLAPALPCVPSLRLAPSTTTTRSSSPSRITALGAKALTNGASLRLHAALGAFRLAPQRRFRLRCQAGSVDENDAVAAGERKVSEVKEQVSERQGPPLLTIVAAVFVSVVVIWGVWSLLSAILGIFFH